MVPMRTYAMSNHFNQMEGFERPQDVHVQARMLREVGIDGYYYNLGRDVAPGKILECAQACSDEGVELAAVYWVADARESEFAKEINRFSKLLEAIPDNCPIEIGFLDYSFNPASPSSKDGMDRFIRFLSAIQPDLRSKGCELRIYPHFGFIVETVEDGLAVLDQLGREGTGMVASGFHSHVAGEDWLSFIRKEPQRFSSVSLCGISKPGEVAGYSIEPLGEGDAVDNGATVASLVEMGYAGWIGIQGFSIPGDSRVLLEKSSAALNQYLRQAE